MLPVKHNLSKNWTIYDWSYNTVNHANYPEDMSFRAFISNVLTDHGTSQKELWCLVAAMDYVNYSSIFTNDTYGLKACVPSPCVIVTQYAGEFYVSCINCNRTPCVSTYNRDKVCWC